MEEREEGKGLRGQDVSGPTGLVASASVTMVKTRLQKEKGNVYEEAINALTLVLVNPSSI